MIERAMIDLAGMPFTVLSVDGSAVAAAFGDDDHVFDHLDERLRGEPVKPAPRSSQVSRALRAYAAGRLDALDAIPVRQPGPPFHQRVWRAMRRVRAGQTTSYGELAARAGAPRAARAAGSACARNHVPLLVPCHRVIRGDGAIGSYFYGPSVKAWLLTHERARGAAARPAS